MIADSPVLSLPRDDRDRSPHTGYTRAHWEAVADRILGAAHAASSPGHALVDFSARRTADRVDLLEGFARTFLLAALRIAGTGGGRPELIEWYRVALRAGIDQTGDERWPRLTDHSQPTVEAAAIALALHLSRPWLWDTLDESTRSSLLDWLGGETGSWCADNNHVLLGATIEAFVASVGGHGDADAIDSALDRIDDWYAGDGWYGDGEGRRFDHYNAWTFHFYPFFVCDMAGARLDERRRLYRQRLGAFLDGYQHLFGVDGSPLIMGRSLIYRWGVVAPFWIAQLEGVPAIDPGRTRRLCSGVLRHFVDAGVASDGRLGLGWHRDHVGMLQSYNAAGSPHWASKGFLGLILPPSHPAWSVPESPLELESRDVRHVLAGPRWLAEGRRADGTVRVHNFGSDGHPQRDDGLYRRLAFSTATAPVLGTSVRDNDVTVPGARHRSLESGSVGVDGGRLRRRLDASGRDVVIDYAVRLADGVEVRAARLRGVIGLPIRVTGYALAGDAAPAGVVRDGAAGGACAEVTTSTQSSTIAWVAASVPVEVEASILRPEVGTALGETCAVPGIEAGPLRANEVTIVWAVALRGAPLGEAVHGSRTPDGGLELVSPTDGILRLHDAGVTVRFAGEPLRLEWTRASAWPGDAVNQGVFRADDRPGRVLSE